MTPQKRLLQYLDANNLYGYAMSGKLPLDGYKWDNVDKFTSYFVKNYDDDGDKGYLLEVDVEYPKDVLSAHGDLPFLLERRYKIPKHHYQERISDINIEEYNANVRKNIAKAHKKVNKAFHIYDEPEDNLSKYVCNISTMKMALNHGLMLQKVHRAMEFNQSAWLKNYIDKNTLLRRLAKNYFEKNFFKPINNAVFGKMIENVRKRREIKLVVTEQRRKKFISEPNYKSCVSFSNHLLAIELRKTRIYMDKPIIVCQPILYKSKELVYHFYYDYLIPKYKENVKMKDEIEEGYMTEFVALSPKVYAFKESCLDNSLIKHKKVKGKNVTKSLL